MRILFQNLARERTVPEDLQILPYAPSNVLKIIKLQRIYPSLLSWCPLPQNPPNVIGRVMCCTAIGVMDDGNLVEVEDCVYGKEAGDLGLDSAADSSKSEGVEGMNTHELIWFAAWVCAGHD